MGKLLQEMKEQLLEAEELNYDMDTTDWGWQIGYLMSWDDLSKLLIYIEGLRSQILGNVHNNK